MRPANILLLSILSAGATYGQSYVIGAVFVRPVAGCPMYVSGVVPKAAADLAGLKEGDMLTAVNGELVGDLPLNEVVKMVTSDGPGEVELTIQRKGDVQVIKVERESRASVAQKFSAGLSSGGMKLMSGVIVPVDTTQAEANSMLIFDSNRRVSSVFPLHYASDPELYSGGFEVFLLRDPAQAVVGGIEDGPASRAGVHWGDIIVQIDGVSTTGKNKAALTKLLSGDKPRLVRLTLDRLGATKKVEFTLAKTADLLKQNGRQMINGIVFPAQLDEDYVKCVVSLKK